MNPALARTRALRVVKEVGLAIGLFPVLVGVRSKVLAITLAATVLAKSRTRWRNVAVQLNVRMADRTTRVFVAGLSELAILREIALEEEYELPADLQPDVIVDLGANVGFASLYFAEARPSAAIYAVEANPDLIQRLEQNLATTQARIVHAAITDHVGEVSFFRNPETWSSSMERRHGWETESRVRGLTLAALRAELGIERIGLLKMDIEGAEWEVLADGFPDRVDEMMGEIHGGPGRDPAQLLESLAETAEVDTIRQDGPFVVFRARPLLA